MSELKCEKEGATYDPLYEERTLVHFAKEEITQCRFRCPYCQGIEIHPVELDEGIDVDMEKTMGGYVEVETIVVAGDPSIYAIQKALGDYTETEMYDMIKDLNDEFAPDEFGKPRDLDDLGYCN